MNSPFSIRRGGIYWVSGDLRNQNVEKDRPYLIISNSRCNRFSPHVLGVPITTKDKKPLPTHVQLWGGQTALCEMVLTIPKEFIGEPLGRCSKEEMAQIEQAVQVSLGLK